jgi:hypothetical protein
MQKADKVEYNGSAHYQFNTIYSCKVQTMKVQTTERKKDDLFMLILMNAVKKRIPMEMMMKMKRWHQLEASPQNNNGP